ncbi:MAG: hypothetical protein Q9213_002591 [Squamulea squamosa]
MSLCYFLDFFGDPPDGPRRQIKSIAEPLNQSQSIMATRWAVDSGEKIGMFLKIEVEYWLALKTSKEASDVDIELFTMDNFEKLLKYRNPKRFERLTREGLQEGLRIIRRKHHDSIERLEKEVGRSSTQSPGDKFRLEFAGYLLSQLKDTSLLRHPEALEQLVIGLRKNESFEKVIAGLNRLYNPASKGDDANKDRPKGLWTEEDCRLLFNWLKFSNHPAYETWTVVDMEDDELQGKRRKLMERDV